MRALADELAGNRDALLGVASQVNADALSLPTRNAGWTVRDVLAHVLASDANLIELLEAPAAEARLDTYESDRAGWAAATPERIEQQLAERAGRWRELLAALPEDGLDSPARAWWIDGPATLKDVLDDYRPHDTQHAEDVRLALEEARA